MIRVNIAHDVSVTPSWTVWLAVFAMVASDIPVLETQAHAGIVLAKPIKPPKSPTQPRQRPPKPPKPRPPRPVAIVTPAPVVVVTPAPPPPPVVRRSWPAPDGWTLSQLGRICTLETAMGTAGKLNLRQWQAREFTLQHMEQGLPPEPDGELRIDIVEPAAGAARPAPSSSAAAAVRRMEFQIETARYTLPMLSPGGLRLTPDATKTLRAALAGGGKARLTVEGKKPAKFRITGGAQALVEMDKCLADARRQPLSAASGGTN